MKSWEIITSLSVEQEVGGSSPPNCTTTKNPQWFSIILIGLTYLTAPNTKSVTNGTKERYINS